MKKFLTLLIVLGAVFHFSSCSNDDGGSMPDPEPSISEVLSGQITEDLTLTNDKIWELQGRVFVTNGATLTIQAGTIIKGQPGVGTNSSGLYIARDGNINAAGTADSPIIFTSTDDNIAIGEKAGTNLTDANSELWGGVVILGNAPISVDAGTTAQIEGVPAAEPLGQYGGSDVGDNQGVFKYVSIRHGGTSIDPAAGKDINGLTLGGVGNGTEISNIEIFANLDDGIEFFGGSVNASNLFIYKVGDDAIDIDQAYSGTITNVVVYTGANSDEVLEIDGPEGDANADGKFTLTDGTAFYDGGGDAADFKSRAQGTVENFKWVGFSGDAGDIKIRASFDESCADRTDAFTNVVSGDLSFSEVEFTSLRVYDGDEDDACALSSDYQNEVNEKILKGTANGANESGFGSWTLAVIGGFTGSVVPVDNVLSGNITVNTTLTADKIWELSGRVFITGGATLTIEPGTIIKGQPGTGTNASGLYIARDGMIDAVGTADKPIIFTSTDDNIQVGQLAGTNLSVSDRELWGGVVILGNAPISVDAGTVAQIEGVPAAETLGQYGGNDATDNRGKLKYVSIRHGGTTIDPAAGKDINGLTLGGVGSGTEIAYVEVIANLDDGVEYFGGSVNTSNMLVYAVGDDALDIDQAYSGTIDNFMIVVSEAAGSDEAFEIDGPEGDTNADGKFTLMNGIVMSADSKTPSSDYKSKAQGTNTNISYPTGSSIKLRVSFDEACGSKADAYSNFIADELTFTNNDADTIKPYDGDGDDSCELTSEQADADAKFDAGSATGASDATVWDGWSLASVRGLI